MNQISGTTSTETAPAQQNGQPPADVASANEVSGFGSRGRIRRRARFLRKARELAYRDLGGLVFNLHRFGQRNDPLVLAKLTTVAQIDTELRTLETALQRREPVTVLREAGINACPRCAAIHSSEDRFCPNCGLPMARNVDLPIASVPAGVTSTAAPVTPAPATQSPPPQTSPPDVQAPPAAAAQEPPPAPPPAEPAVPAAEHPISTETPVAAPATGRSPHPPSEAPNDSITTFGSDTAPALVEEPTEILKPQPPQP